MNPFVVNELRVLVEGFPTFTTFVRFLPTVETLMSNKTLTPTKSLATLTTFVRLVPSVGSPVVQELGALSEGFGTLMAFRWFLPIVESLVLTKMGTELVCLPALTTFIRPLHRMCSEVNS